MHYALLQRLATTRLPVLVDRPEEIELVLVLQMAGHLKASIAAVPAACAGADAAPATMVIVTEVTAIGRMALRAFAPGIPRGR